MTDETFDVETKATAAQQQHWQTLFRLFENRGMGVADLMSNLGLYARSSALVKILFVSELYEMIRDVPGVIMEFGVWFGQNLVLFENLRAIHEPFNHTRRIIGFDTFSGYTGISAEADVPSSVVQEGGHRVPEDYASYLRELLRWHEQNNVLGHIQKHEIIQGDVTRTVPDYFEKHPNTIVACAYLDLALYEPTRVCLETIRTHLVPGSVVMLDGFNDPRYPGETKAFRETLSGLKVVIRKSRIFTDRSFIVVQP